MIWSILGESLTGVSHRARNVPCQDSFRFCSYGPKAEWLVIAVADGAGTASHSADGATLACNEFVRLVSEVGPDQLLTRDSMVAIFSNVRNALFLAAERLSVRPRDMACTCLLGVIGPNNAAFGQIGDGAIVIGKGEGHRAIFWPEPTEYANATDFITDETFPSSMRFEAVTEIINEVAALTDGLQRVALDYSACAPYPGFFLPLFNVLWGETNFESLAEPFREFLDSNRVNDRTDDDKTLVLAVRHL